MHVREAYLERIVSANEIKNDVQIELFAPPQGTYFIPKGVVFENIDGDNPYDPVSGLVSVHLGGYAAANFSLSSLMMSGGQNGAGVVIIGALNSETVTDDGTKTVTQGFPLDGNFTGPPLYAQFISSNNPNNANGDADGTWRVRFYFELQTYGQSNLPI